jgi:hypothetical protein
MACNSSRGKTEGELQRYFFVESGKNFILPVLSSEISLDREGISALRASITLPLTPSQSGNFFFWRRNIWRGRDLKGADEPFRRIFEKQST